ncbi:BTAD domain-containing putative transcriptional regulator, partial [Actinoplanes sp. NPDC048791]|uniref:BTAD domain-containing putative transcriptional regulator n=1 Tax=Actinoplanes sp. NPDC048791 TaxID=3154623 RepID=UPI0033C20FB2
MRFGVLGPLAVTTDAGEPVVVPGAKVRVLLADLLANRNQVVSADRLIDDLWADDVPANPLGALQVRVSQLRKALNDAEPGARDLVESRSPGYVLRTAEVDADHFTQLAGASDVETLTSALKLWRGDAYADMADEEFVRAEATRLTEQRLTVRERLADARLARGEHDLVTAELAELVARYPLRESLRALHLRALYAAGRQTEALDSYADLRERLADELGLDPGPEVAALHRKILEQDSALSPPPKAAIIRNSLPARLDELVGRAEALAELRTLVPGQRLVTLIGPGGVGKTRLATEVAREQSFPDGVHLVELAPLPARDPGIAERVLATLGVHEAAGASVTPDDRLTVALRGRQLLIVLDNCEHVIEPAAALVARVLREAPGVTVLATSREPLAVDGETLVPLGPLALPAVDDGVEAARQAAAVRLFTERATAVRPGFGVDESTLAEVVQVVRGLDGMPLALELAAARLRTLSLTQLAAGLTDRFRLLSTGNRAALPRHRTLRAVIAWSWELLSESERTVAERVSILPGGVTPASGAAVCADTAVPADELPELLASLVDRSLLQLAPEPGRYRMLETLREYGIDRLATADALGTARDLAADHFTALLARSDPKLRGPGQAAALRLISAEYDNTLAALRRRCDTGDSHGAVTLALHLTWYWHMLGRRPDAAYWLGEALAVPGGSSTPERDCARAIQLFNRLDTGPGTTAGETAAQLRGTAGRLLAYPELPRAAGALAALALAFLREEQAALTLIERMAAGADGWLAGLARMFRAEFAENAGRLDEVRTDISAALAGFRQAGDRWGQATVLPVRAQLRQYDDDLDGALADLREARSLAGEFGSLSLGDEVFLDLRWIDLHLRRGDTGPALATIGSARERAVRAQASELLFLVDAWEADFRLRLGDPDRASSSSRA